MGTSTPYGGPQNGLLPSWLDKPTVTNEELPTFVSPDTPPDIDPSSIPVLPKDPSISPLPQTKPKVHTNPKKGGSLKGARTSFTQFAKKGSRSKLDRSLSGYVRGTGGSGNATRRMGSSRNVAAALLAVAKDFQNVGPKGTLKLFNLEALQGHSAEEVFTHLIEHVCPTGGTVDEGIARIGMLGAIEKLAEADVGSFEQLTFEQVEEFVADFISNTIEARIFNDIGTHGINLPESVAAVNNIQNQLHDVISGCVRAAFAEKLEGISQLTDQDIANTVDQLYENAFDFITALVDTE